MNQRVAMPFLCNGMAESPRGIAADRGIQMQIIAIIIKDLSRLPHHRLRLIDTH